MEALKYKNRKNNEPTRENLQDDAYALLKLLEEPDFEITQKVDDYKEQIIAQENPTNSARCDLLVPSNVVPGLHQIANLIRLL